MSKLLGSTVRLFLSSKPVEIIVTKSMIAMILRHRAPMISDKNGKCSRTWKGHQMVAALIQSSRFLIQRNAEFLTEPSFDALEI